MCTWNLFLGLRGGTDRYNPAPEERHSLAQGPGREPWVKVEQTLRPAGCHYARTRISPTPSSRPHALAKTPPTQL